MKASIKTRMHGAEHLQVRTQRDSHRKAPDLGQVACPPRQLLQGEGGHDVHGRPAALVQAAPVLVGGLLVARVRECPVHALCACAASAPAAQLVGYDLHSCARALLDAEWQQQSPCADAPRPCLLVASRSPGPVSVLDISFALALRLNLMHDS